MSMILFLLTLPSSDHTRCLLKGKVTDELGAAISQAQVTVHWDPSGSQVGLTTNVGIREDLILQTDKLGVFKAELPPGFYDLFVSSGAFSPECKKVRLKENAPLSMDFSLRVNPLVAKELGHEVYTK